MKHIDVLIVEDEVIVAENLSLKLQNLGYTVAGIAVSGNEAVEMALLFRPQLILMDIKLQGELDGIETVEKIKKHLDIPVIYLTAHSDRNTLARAKTSKPNGYVLKPFDELDLAAQIELALYKHEADRQVREQREWLRVTLASIGDAVIATDAEGVITFLNPVAESLTGWPADEAIGTPLGNVFRIINEYTREPVEDPVHKVLQTGAIVGLANHTLLIRRDGKEVPIDDSGAPIKDSVGRIQGVVLTFRDISESKKVEKAIFESEQRLRLFVEHAPAALAMFDSRMRYFSVSRRWLMDYKLGDRDLTGLCHYDVFPEITEQLKEVHKRALNGEVITGRGDRFERANGSVQWLHWEVRPWRDQLGKIGGIVVFSEDVTELKKSEENLRRYELLSQHSRDMILYIRHEDGQILEANTAAVQTYGYSYSELIGMTIKDLRAPDTNNLTASQMTKAVKEGLLFETIHRRKDGTTFPVEVSSQGAKINDTNMLVSVVRDITERKKGEEALELSEQRRSLALEAANAGTWEWDLQTDENIWSNELWRLYGLEPFSCKPSYSELQKIIHPEDLPMADQTIKEAIRKGVAYSIEWRVRPNDGKERWLMFRGKPFKDTHDRVVRYLGTAIDVTERKQVEEQNRALQTKLIHAQKMEAIGTLAGGIAHDFNNILMAIIGYAEMAKEDCPANSEIGSDLGQVLEAGRRATDLVKQILLFSRQDTAERIPIKPGPLVKEALRLLRPALPSTIDIKQQIDVTTQTILIDPTQFHQILMNLCTNAYHAMEKTGGNLEITLQERYYSPKDVESHPAIRTGKFIELSVSDTGPGISPEIQDKIFDPYFTTKEVGKGTGLGLAIVNGIVAAADGFITCESGPENGATFRVSFPVVEQEAVLDDKQTDKDLSGNEHILLVDDEEALAKMGQVMLERLGYTVTIRTNSMEALVTFRNQPDQFDAVITDQTMPGITGSALSRMLLQIRPDIPIILCTGFSTLINEDQARAFGIKEFAMKPLVRKELAKLLRKVLDGKESTADRI